MKRLILSFLFIINLVFSQTNATAPSGSGTSSDPYLITNLANLSWLTQNSSEWDKYYKQTIFIDASSTQYWDDSDDDSDGDNYNDTNDGTSSGNNEGFKPIGIHWNTGFTGTYDGNSYKIDNLTINRSSESFVGLFGATLAATIIELGLSNVNITGASEVGSLAGYNQGGTLTKCYSTGAVSGSGNKIGGLVGSKHLTGTFGNSYTTVSVGGTGDKVGGLVGYIAFYASIENCYSIGSVSGASNVGGLVGYTHLSDLNNTTVANSFWDIQTSNQSTSNRGTGKTTAEMKTASTFTSASWDFELETANGDSNYWDIDDINGTYNSGYPFLSWQNGDTILFDYDVSLVITEIMQNPSAVNDSDGEWFEIFNSGNIEMDLNGWIIKDADTDNHTISSSLVIEPDDYLVFGNNSSSSTNGGVTVDYQYLDVNLANGADELILVDPNGVVFDSVAYDGGTTFPDPTGASMALQSPELDNDVGTNWFVSTLQFGDGDLGTPGMPNYMSNIELDTSFVNFDTVNVNETATSTIVISNTGNDDLVVDSVAIYSGSINTNSLSFDGSDDYVEVVDNVSFDFSAFSIGLWVKPNSIPSSGSDHAQIINKRWLPSQNITESFGIEAREGMIGIYARPSSWVRVQQGYDNFVGSWHYLVMTSNGTQIEFFYDGVSQGTANADLDPTNNNRNIAIAYGDNFFNGKIDEVSIWNIALTEAQIQFYMSISLSGSETGLVGYWDFNEGTGTTLADKTSNGNDGTINGATWSNDVPPVSTISTDESNDFTIALDNYTITPASTGNLTISFLPTVYGYLSATAQIYTNDPDQSVVLVGMSGFGYYPSPDIELESSSIDFGDVMHGLTEQESFTIYNTGETALDIDTIYCTANFSVNPGSAGVDAGDSLSLVVTFAPDDDSSFTNTMTIVSNDPDEDTLTVSLSGTGTAQAPIMEVSADLMDFGVFEQEQSITRQLTIYNNGMLDLAIEEINISGNSGFSTTFSDATVVPNDSVVVDFQFYTEDNITEAFATATIVSTNADNMNISLRAGYFGPVWYVSTGGSDETGNGSEQYPFATIQHGIDGTSDGDTVLVAEGTYVENVWLPYNIHLISESGPSQTIIDGTNVSLYAYVIKLGSTNQNVSITGFTLTGGNNYYDMDQGWFGGAIWGNFHGNGGSLVISNTLFINNDIEFAFQPLYGWGGGSSDWAIEINNCTFFLEDAQWPLGISGDSQNIDVTSSILYGDSNQVFNESMVLNISYSLISPTLYTDEYFSDNGNNVFVNPLFCNPDSNDFTLAENSPCVGTGSPSGTNMGAFGIGCGPYNFSPTEFSLSTPSNNAQITIDESNVDNGFITFSWGESSDANDDSLYYLMRATSAEIGDHELDTNATSIDISYMDIIEDMSENNVTAASLEWTVHVTDGIDTVEADNAPYTMGIDGSNALSAYLEGLLPDEFALHQNYPNPFNPVTTLRYDLPENGYVNITIYDMLGRQVKTLINQSQDAGYRSIIWDATNDYGKPVSAGIYLYQIQAGEYISTKKMVLLK